MPVTIKEITHFPNLKKLLNGLLTKVFTQAESLIDTK